MLTEIRLKRFDKRSFKSGKVDKSTSSGKDNEFSVTVLAGTGWRHGKDWSDLGKNDGF